MSNNVCKPGCGGRWFSRDIPGGQTVAFCSAACKDAGRALNPPRSADAPAPIPDCTCVPYRGRDMHDGGCPQMAWSRKHQPSPGEELAGEMMRRDFNALAPPPVDRTAITTLHGTPVDELRAQQAAEPTGMHADYIVLADEERAKGFVRPVRRTYLHLKCRATTTMGQRLAETYARDPKFYGATFCCNCDAHFPVGADGEFVWDGTTEKVGT